jgi:hypothetical protein
MADLHKAHNGHADCTAEQTTYQEKYKFVHSELLSAFCKGF